MGGVTGCGGRLVDRFRDGLVVEHLPVGVALFDAAGMCVRANPAFAHLVACDPPGPTSLSIDELVAPLFGPVVAADALHAVSSAVSGGADVITFADTWSIGGSLRPRYLDCEIRAIASEEDETLAMMTLVDVTARILERRSLEEEGGLAMALTHLTTVIGFSTDVDDILREVVTESADAVGCDSAAVLTRDEDRWVVRHASGMPTGMLGLEFSLEDLPVGEAAMMTRRAAASDDAAVESSATTSARDWGAQAVLATPLVTRGEVSGLLFFNHDHPHVFPPAVVDFANRLSTTVSLALDNASLHLADRETTDALQSALFGRPHAMPGVEFGHLYRSATRNARVGGDFYDVFRIDARQIGVLIGDVSGRGLEAAALTALVKNSVKVHAEDGLRPAQVLAKTNDVVYRESRQESFVTAFFGVLDVETGLFRYCLAGHPPPILRRGEGSTVTLCDGCPILGAYEGMPFEDRETFLEQGDVLLLYTDGVTEARREGALYGERRLTEFVAGLASVDCHELPEQIFEEVFSHARGDLVDDMAMLAIAPTLLSDVGRSQGRLAL